VRVVGHQADRPDTKCPQACGRIGERATIDREPKSLIRLQRVETAILKDVCTQLVRETDPSPLVAGGIYEDAATLRGDRALCLPKLHAAVASERSERVTGQAFRMETDQDVLAVPNRSPAQTQVNGPLLIEGAGRPFAEGSGQRQLRELRGDDRR